MTSTARHFSAVLLLLLLAGTATARDGVSLRLVAQPDDEATGLEKGETINPTPTRDTLYIDRYGAVLFPGEVTGSGGTAVQVNAVYLASVGKDIRGIAVPGEEVPQAGGLDVKDWWIFEVVDARLSVGGNATVEARIRSDPFINRAILANLEGEAVTLVAEHMTLPAICRLKRFGDDSFPEDWIANGGTVAFQGQFNKDFCPSDHEAVFRHDSLLGLRKIFEDNDPVPGRATATFDEDFRGLRCAPDGTALIYAPFVDGPDYIRALVIAGPVVTLTEPVVAMSGEVRPGVSGSIVDFRQWTIAPGREVLDAPRTGFVADVEELTDSYLIVSDSAASIDPVLVTGDTLDDYTFTATQFTAIDLALVGDDVLVVVGNTTKGGGSEVPAVWRYRETPQPTMEVALCEGEPVAGLGADPIEQIYTVNVNAEGRIVAEVLYQSKQTILMEEPDGGPFRVVVQQGDLLPAREGTVELVGIARSYPADPPLTGPGLDGRQSRFNERGEFVFLGRAVYPGGGIRSGVYVVSMDVKGCDVTARVKGKNLVISNGDCAARITVESDAAGNYTVVPGSGTTINGERASWSGTATGSLSISMGGGDDVVTMTTSAAPDDPFDVTKNLTVDAGSGNDTIAVTGYAIGGNLTVLTGAGAPDGKDVVTVHNVHVSRNLKVAGGDGQADISVSEVRVDGKAALTNADGDGSWLGLSGCELAKTKIRGGRGDDTLTVDETKFVAPVKIDVGTGSLDSLFVREALLTNGGLSISTKKSTRGVVQMENVELSKGSLSVSTGKTGASVEMTSCAVQGKVKVKTGGSGAGFEERNRIRVADCEFWIWLSIKGKGRHDIVITDGSFASNGIAVNTKGGTEDVVAVRDTRILQGSLQVGSKAERFRGEFLRNYVMEGAVAIRTGTGNDEVVLTGGSSSGIVQVITSHGDDVVKVNGMKIGGDLRLGGGHGNDLLNNGLDAPNTVGGEVKEDSFEGAAP